MRIRAATASDLDALLRIYNHYVTHTHVTFDIEPLSPEARRPWLDGFAPSGPHRLLVGEDAKGVIGYACSTRFRPKPAYDTSVETTVYLDADRLGHGHGRELYAALLQLLEAEAGAHRAFAGVALPNAASVALHRDLGFREIGTFREAGFKFGKFWDVIWYEKDLSHI